MSEGPVWGTADTPAMDLTSDSVTFVVRVQIGSQVEIVGIAASRAAWEEDVAGTMTDVVSDLVDALVRTGMFPEAMWRVEIGEDTDGKV